MPNAVPRSLPLKACAISASDVASMIAPPMPCTARAKSSIVEEPESPQTSEAAENAANPIANNLRRPNMSPTTPAVSRNAAIVRA
jgi:hypothetical protein